MNELVSVIMPSFNTGKFIADSIKSVLSQTYQNFELIIVDDNSSDFTDEVVASFSDERIRYFKNDANCGAAVSRNIALKQARGRYIAFLDSDDIWVKNKLEKQIAFMQNNGYAFSYTEYSEMDENSQALGVKVSGPKKITRRGMYNFCWPGCLTVMYDANIIGLLQIADIKKNNDYALWLYAIEKADCYLLKEDLAFYRKRAGSISSHSYLKLIKWHYRLYHEALDKSAVVSVALTVVNLFFGVIKKVFYKKKK